MGYVPPIILQGAANDIRHLTGPGISISQPLPNEAQTPEVSLIQTRFRGAEMGVVLESMKRKGFGSRPRGERFGVALARDTGGLMRLDANEN